MATDHVPTTWRRCPSDKHGHGDDPGCLRLEDAVAELAPPCPRTAADVAALREELRRRVCGGGPLVAREDGVLDRLASDEFIGEALASLPEDDADGGSAAPALRDVLTDMGIRHLEDLRSFRRLVAVHAAQAALSWATATPERAASAAAALLQEIDDPSEGWR